MAPKNKSATLDVVRMQGKTAPELPPPFHDVLPSGLEADWRMPDIAAILSFDTTIPDPYTDAILRLLEEEKASRPETDPRARKYSALAMKGMYALAAHMMEKPKLDIRQAYGDGNGTLGRREIGFYDVRSLYWSFLVGTRTTSRSSADADQPSEPANAPHDGGDVQETAE